MRAFTLVELLVVITIIVILLALLVPALDKAMYQAQLVQCAGRMKTLATGSNTYAFDYKRFYPYETPAPPENRTVRAGPRILVEMEDMRPLIRPYIFSINKVFNDPLLKEVDFEPDLLPGQGFRAWADYNWFASWGYAGPRGKIMRKIGDTMEFTNRSTGVTHRFMTLVGDRNLRVNSQVHIQGSHPDQNGTMVEVVNPTRDVTGAFAVLSQWSRTRPDHEPTYLDLNFAQQDESVIRYANVLFDHPDWDQDAPGLIPVPDIPGDVVYPDTSMWLPPR
jgi:prepilin-type N-terminal cleavage/methylation domain-containing protein